MIQTVKALPEPPRYFRFVAVMVIVQHEIQSQTRTGPKSGWNAEVSMHAGERSQSTTLYITGASSTHLENRATCWPSCRRSLDRSSMLAPVAIGIETGKKRMPSAVVIVIGYSYTVQKASLKSLPPHGRRNTALGGIFIS